MTGHGEGLPQPPFITSPTLEKMYRLPVDIGVPFLGDAVIVGGHGSSHDGKTRLEVTKSHYEVTITREDARPLQVVIGGKKMLEQPIGSLLLTRSTRPSDAITAHDTPMPPRLGWELATEAKITDPFMLEQFANTVGTFALKKQREKYFWWQLWLSSKL